MLGTVSIADRPASCIAHLAGDQSRLSLQNRPQAWLAHLMRGRAAVYRENSRMGGRIHREESVLGRLRLSTGGNAMHCCV